jgi:peptide/nickel transport system substrate-binding protein
MAGELWTPAGAGRAISRRNALALGLAAGAAFGARPGRAAAQAAPQPPAKPTGQVIVGLSQEPTKFNPLMPHIEVDQGVHWNLFSPLWGVDDKGDFTPQLAAEIPTVENGGISEDGLTWKVKLGPA